MVACAFAHRHKRGYIFRDEADRRYLIGHECGAKHFGLGNWQSFTAGRERLEERGSYLRVIRDLADTLRAHRDWIAGLPKNPAVRAFDALRVDLRTLFPGLVSAIKSVISRHDGVLTVTVEARDYAAEERRREREQEARAWYTGLGERERAQFHTKGGRAPTVDKSPLRKREARALGTLRGSVLFSNSPALGQAMREVLPLVDAFLAMPRTPTTRRDLLGVTRNARELVTRVLRVRDSLLDAVEFFDRDNLERVARWADALRIDGLHYVANAGRVDAELIEGGSADPSCTPRNYSRWPTSPLTASEALSTRCPSAWRVRAGSAGRHRSVLQVAGRRILTDLLPGQRGDPHSDSRF
jgi:hypothetical protein